MKRKNGTMKEVSLLELEDGVTLKNWNDKISIALVYPNTYQVGMSNLGIHILYREMNKLENVVCERVFWPDEEGQRVKSIESQRELKDFDVVAFALSFEMDGFHLLDILSRSGIEVLAANRGEADPLILMGGPCPTFNPEPWAHFIDGMIIGEGEEILPEVVSLWSSLEGMTKDEKLEKMLSVGGLYVPKFYRSTYDEAGRFIGMVGLDESVPSKIEKRMVDLAKYAGCTEIISPATEFGHMFLIEVARGCGRHCRFCMAGYAFRNPRVRPVSEILAAIEEGKARGAKQIGLVGAAVSDHPQIDELVRAVDAAGLDLSVASLRADNVSQVLLEKLVKSGQRTVTFAPETGSERLRKVINKGLNEEELLKACLMAIQTGMKHIRLYAMLGLPTETQEDVAELVNLARKIRKLMKENHHAGKVVLSVNPFIPKPFTPFEKMPLFDEKEIEKKIHFLRKELPLKEGYEIKAESLREAWVQGILARADRSISEVILQCGERGYKAFSQTFRKAGFEKERYEYQNLDLWKAMPWQVVDLGIRENYFEEELVKAEKELETLACFEGCQRCGVCSE